MCWCAVKKLLTHSLTVCKNCVNCLWQFIAKSTAMRPSSKSTHFTVSFVRMRHSVGLYSALFPFHRMSVPLGDDRRAIKKLFLVHRLGKHLGELSLFVNMLYFFVIYMYYRNVKQQNWWPSASVKVIGNHAIRYAVGVHHLLVVFHCKYVSILHHFRID